MREIKFKIWDNTKNQMFFQKEHKFLILPGKETPKDFENVELLQFTGLKDKNGKEIYEGDILKVGEKEWFDKNCFITGLVEFTNSGWKFAGKIPYSYEPPTSRVHNTPGTNYDTFELIGNIYENPELLTK